ncbi:expressed unknown protein [Seminavis robusta]|uniref:Uncharacterized protein n=1 Tax=Seminavis robusta TaxID=568900 RepID=A0A9N8DL01_9STRA|nr:expressed unknown protein [Seminavis robusta]|eukprot:Sro187_g081040.1 n/a (286) ;mRNA; f:79362-80219
MAGMNSSTTAAPPFENGKPFEFQFWARKEGHVGTGDLPGHLLAAAIYLALGGSLLGRCFDRAKRGQSIHLSSPFALHRTGTVMVWVCSIGVLEQMAFGALIETISPSPFKFLPHLVMYSSYILVGLVARWESQQRLPKDSFRGVLAMAFVVNGYMVLEHAQFKRMPQDGKFHQIWGQLNMVNAAILVYSIHYPKNVIAHVLGWALMVLTALWLITIGVFCCCWDLPVHLIPTLLGIEVLVCMGAILIIAVSCIPPQQSTTITTNHDSTGEEYNPLKQDEEAGLEH